MIKITTSLTGAAVAVMALALSANAFAVTTVTVGSPYSRSLADGGSFLVDFTIAAGKQDTATVSGGASIEYYSADSLSNLANATESSGATPVDLTFHNPGVSSITEYLEVISTTANSTNFTVTLAAPATNTVNHISTPEPATWALMLMGVGGIGAVLRRQVKSSAVAA